MRLRTEWGARYIWALLAFATIAPMACGEDVVTLTSPGDAPFTFSGGTAFTIILQTVGPGAYESPPTISSGAVRFLDVSQAAVAVPAGPTQRFRFQAVSPGRAIIAFHHSGSNPVVTDTIIVR